MQKSPISKRRSLLMIMGAIFLSASLSSLTGALNLHAKDFTLQSVHQDIRQKFSTVTHLGPEALNTGLKANADEWLLFDVREHEEFNVSHIKGAALLPPGTSVKTFIKNHGAGLNGKRVVFYCSVGMRSSQMAERLQKAAFENGVASVHNLKQGLFGWSNRNYTMVNRGGKTPYIHPYSKHWGQLLVSRENWRYKAE